MILKRFVISTVHTGDNGVLTLIVIADCLPMLIRDEGELGTEMQEMVQK